MQSIWQKHLIICLPLGLVAIPVHFLDMASMEGGGGNWITFDFRGYVALLAIDVVVSSFAILSFRNWGTLRIHLGSIALSMILLITGFIIYGKLLCAQNISGRPASLPEAVADL